MIKIKTEYLGGLPVDILTHEDIISDIPNYMNGNKKMVITSVNPQITMMAHEFEEVYSYIHNATHRIADGVGVVKLSKWTGGNLRTRITGIDVMENCLIFANRHKLRVFLFGAQKDILEKTKINIGINYPNLKIVGHLHGYTNKEEELIVDQINKVKPDFLFVALGSPRQEIFLEKNINKLAAFVFLDVGGTFDVLSGVVKRAPTFFIDHNIEWLYRSIKYQRYERLVQIPHYILKVLKYKNSSLPIHKHKKM